MSKFVINSKNVDVIFDVPAGKIRLIHLNITHDRKLLHQYLETNYPKLYKQSLYCSYHSAERLHTFIKCYECDYKNVCIDTYNHGIMPNNIDEWRSGKCPSCGETVTFEPNYDDYDDIRIVWKNNVVAFGNYFRSYRNPVLGVSKNISPNEIIGILNGKHVYEIAEPALVRQKQIKKKQLCKYLDAQIELVNKYQ
jgi:hypothetical protein